MPSRICVSSLIRRKQSFLRLSGTGCRSCEKTNAVPQKRNGKDCSPGFCSVPIAEISCTLLPVRTLTASKTTMYAPATKAVEAPVLHTISGKMCCGSWCWNGFRRSTSTSAATWRVSGGMAALSPRRSGTGHPGRSEAHGAGKKAPCKPRCGHVPAL